MSTVAETGLVELNVKIQGTFTRAPSSLPAKIEIQQEVVPTKVILNVYKNNTI